MNSPIIVALDFDSEEETLAFIQHLDPLTCRVKIATTLFTRYGPDLIARIQDQGFDVFLDLKFHDIPKQVEGACRQAARLGVWMVTVHCAGGYQMLVSAREGLEQSTHKRRPLLVGVTVLTSLSSEDLSQVGMSHNVIEAVEKMAQLAHFAKIDGVVSSAVEVQMIREAIGTDFITVTPGIRLKEDALDDQKRVMTPEKAVQLGSHYIVMGRSITRSVQPAQTVMQVLGSITQAS